MYAVIRTDGRQHRITKGEVVRLDRRQAEVGSPIQLGEVLLVNHGGQTTVGSPLVADALVEGKVVRHLRGPKIRIYKYKRRKGFSRTQGYRHDFTEVLIQKISLKGEELQAEQQAAAQE